MILFGIYFNYIGIATENTVSPPFIGPRYNGQNLTAPTASMKFYCKCFYTFKIQLIEEKCILWVDSTCKFNFKICAQNNYLYSNCYTLEYN